MPISWEIPRLRFFFIHPVVRKHGNICIAGQNRRAGYAIDQKRFRSFDLPTLAVRRESLRSNFF
jgi:hypothetical protein